ncbi:MAG: hypothetical protein KDA79_19795 [Planctomycetaceae bacterium]|nr:hypothetical protein [Planctomycetaceae bacterium]
MYSIVRCAVSVRGQFITAASVLSVIAGVCSISGCIGNSKQLAPSLHSVDPEVTLSRLEAAIPAGTSVESAVRILDEDHWTCVEGVPDQEPDKDNFVLACVYSYHDRPFVTDTTMVWLRHADGIVVEIDVRQISVGP